MRSRTGALVLLVVAVAAIGLASGCAPGPNPFVAQGVGSHAPAGFLLGLWHGVIVWVTFVLSLFDGRVSVYEVHNNGWQYNLGFVIGAAFFHGGGARASRRRRRREG